MKEWFEIFATGTWVDSQGRKKTYTQADLDKIVSQYNPQENEAPIVIGHPETNSPAWGWIGKLKRVGDRLLALPSNVVEEFAEMVKKGLFKKRSISLNPDLTLRHVGFLGAAAPAVKGLEDISFEESAAALEYSTEFNDWRMGMLGRMFQRLRDFFIDKYDLDTANQVIPQYEIEELSREPQAIEAVPSAFSEKDQPVSEDENMDLKELQTQYEELKKQFDELKAQYAAKEAEAGQYQQQLTEQEKKARREKITAFCQSLVKSGRLTQGQVEAVTLVLETLHDAEPLKFSDSKEKSAAEVLQEFLQKLPEQIVLREIADGKTGEESYQEDNRQASDYAGQVTEDRLKLRNEAKLLAMKEKIPFTAAVRRLMAQ